MATFLNPDASFFNESSGGPVFVASSPVPGSTIKMRSVDRVLFVNAGLLASLTVWLPKGVEPGEVVELGFETGVTNLTVRDGRGTIVPSAPSFGLGPGVTIFLKYISKAYGWFYWGGGWQPPPAAIYVLKSGDLLSGFLTAHADPVSPMHLATKQYVDNTTLTQAEADALFLTSAEADVLFLTKSEGDALYLTSTTADALFLTQSEGDSRFVNIAGDTITGTQTLANGASLKIKGYPVAGTGPVLHIGMWEDTSATNLHQSLFIQHWYNAVGGTTAGVASPIGMQINIQGAPEYYVWGINLEMDIRTTGASAQQPQHVGYASTIRRHSSDDVAFAYYGMIEDMSGETIGSDVGFELDIRCNGPEAPVTEYASQFGGRAIMTMNGQVQNGLPSWLANHAYAKDDVILPVPPNGHVYKVTIAGTSGATQPVWPTSGTVTNGTATFKYGTTYKAQISRALNIGTDPEAAFGCGILFTGNFYNAAIDMTAAVLDTVTNPTAAGIRLAEDLPIDFSGGPAAVLQNRHVLVFDSASQELQYITRDTSNGYFPRLAIHADGGIRIWVPPHAINDAAAATANVPIGGIYRNGSDLMVRTV